MPRPARQIWVTRTYARTRHRSWMLSMTFASLGWGTWWLLLLGKKLAEDDPGIFLPSVVSTVFAVLGLGVALLTLRARRAWMLFALIPMLANASLLAMPWLAAELTSP
jgi:hypothetical protein